MISDSAKAPNLTVIQMRVYNFIRSAIEKDHCPPTEREIAGHFGWRSSNSAHGHIEALMRKGLLTRLPNSARGIRLVELPVLMPPPDAPTIENSESIA